MSRRFVATISPSLDKLKSYIGGALSRFETHRHDQTACMASVKQELEAAWEYLSVFDGADEVLIPAFARIKGDIGKKRIVGEFDAKDFAYHEVYRSTGLVLGETSERNSTSISATEEDVRSEIEC